MAVRSPCWQQKSDRLCRFRSGSESLHGGILTVAPVANFSSSRFKTDSLSLRVHCWKSELLSLLDPAQRQVAGQSSESQIRRLASVEDGFNDARSEKSALQNPADIPLVKAKLLGNRPAARIGTCVRFDPKTVADWLRKQ